MKRMRGDRVERGRCGSTWVNWLVGLLLVLAAVVVFYPVFVGSAEPRHLRSTLSHAKQLATACQLYMADFDQRLPIASRWMDSIYPYLKNEDIFIDPDLVDRKEGEYGFAFFELLSGVDASAVTDPASVPLIFQSSLLHRNVSSDLSTLPVPARSKGGNVVGFLDGHVERLPKDWPESPVVLRFKPDSEHVEEVDEN